MVDTATTPHLPLTKKRHATLTEHVVAAAAVLHEPMMGEEGIPKRGSQLTAASGGRHLVSVLMLQAVRWSRVLNFVPLQKQSITVLFRWLSEQ
jgi:hypothetical protein